MGEYKAYNQTIYNLSSPSYAPYLRFGDYLCTGYPGALLNVYKGN